MYTQSLQKQFSRNAVWKHDVCNDCHKITKFDNGSTNECIHYLHTLLSFRVKTENNLHTTIPVQNINGRATHWRQHYFLLSFCSVLFFFAMKCNRVRSKTLLRWMVSTIAAWTTPFTFAPTRSIARRECAIETLVQNEWRIFCCCASNQSGAAQNLLSLREVISIYC